MYNYGQPAEYPKWLKEDIKDMVEELKEGEKKWLSSPQTLLDFAHILHRKSEWVYSDAIELERKAELVERIVEDWKNGYNWLN